MAVTPPSIDFSDYDKANLVVFNTEDYVKDFSLNVFGSGFSVDQSSLKIPPRSNANVSVSSSCNDCEARLYIRELSKDSGIRVEPAVAVKLFSGNPPEEQYYGLEDYEQPDEVTSFFFIDVTKPEILIFIILFGLLLTSSLIFFGRKFYIKKFSRKSKSRKRTWLKKLF